MSPSLSVEVRGARWGYAGHWIFFNEGDEYAFRFNFGRFDRFGGLWWQR